MGNTQDLSKFGFREYGMASDLLNALADNKFQSDQDDIYSGIKLEFNQDSGNVFLVDNDYNILMLNDNKKLENWLNCSNCGKEGFRSELEKEGFKDGLCKECIEKEK